MSNQYPTNFVNTYSTNVELNLQQMGSSIRKAGAVREQSVSGEQMAIVDQIGPVNPTKPSARHQHTEIVETPHSRRWVVPESYDAADYIDEEDKVRALIDPQNPYARNHAMTMGRAHDDEIIAAFFATSKVGKTGSETEAFDTSQYQIAAGSAGLTVAKLREARRLLMQAEVQLDLDPIYLGITSRQHDDLLGDIQSTNRDYTGQMAPLVNGVIPGFMGFKFIVSERFLSTGSNRRCPAWARSGMALGVWIETRSTIDRLPERRNSTQVFTTTTVGATRTEQGKVIEILCDES